MIGLLFRVIIWTIVVLATLTILALWAFCWLIVFIVTFVWTAFDSSRQPKRLERPRIARRRRSVGAEETDAFGHPIPQSRWSSRR
jgi:hypothetical protein